MRNRLTGLLAIAAIVASACSSANATPTAPPVTQPPVTPAPAVTSAPPAASPTAAGPDLTATTYKPEPVGKTGGKLVMGEWQEPTSIWWNVYDNAAADVEAFGPSMWSLWNATADFKWYGQLATNIPTVANGGVKILSNGGMDVTINLLPGAMWSDGQPITCDDLAYEVTWFMDKGQVGNIQGTVGWENITGVDGGTTSNCVAHFSKQYEYYLGLWSPVLPKHYLSTASVADAATKLYTQKDPSSGVYSGPYMPTAWASGAEIDYVPNKQFWTTIKKATAPFDAVVYKVYGSNTDETAGFKNNEIDVAMDYNHNDIKALSTAGIDQASIDAVDGPTYEQHSWNFADLTKKFGADGAKALMQALHYAYDKDRIIQQITGGVVQPICNFNSPKSWWYANIPCPAFDYSKANSILTTAGFKKGADGVLVAPNGTKVELLACTSASRQYRIDTLTLLGSLLLQNIGVKLVVHPTPSTNGGMFPGWTQAAADTPCNLTHGNFDVAEFAWVPPIDPDGIYTTYLSTYDPSNEATGHGGNNEIRVNIPALDAALNDMNSTVDLNKVQTDMNTIQALYVDPANSFPEIPLYFWKTVSLHTSGMHNVVTNPTSATDTWNIEDWWHS
jgi:ABC-type transport system substrate-binding protein